MVVQFSSNGGEVIVVPMLVATDEIPILQYNVIEDLILSGSLEHQVALEVTLKMERGRSNQSNSGLGHFNAEVFKLILIGSV